MTDRAGVSPAKITRFIFLFGAPFRREGRAFCTARARAAVFYKTIFIKKFFRIFVMLLQRASAQKKAATSAEAPADEATEDE